MIRTQVYIPDEQFRDLQFLSQKEEKNQSELIREGIVEVLKKYQTKRKKRDWSKFIGAGGKGGPKDLSQKIDDYLYGEKSVWGKK